MTLRHHSARPSVAVRIARGLLIAALVATMVSCGGDDEPATPEDNAPAAEQEEEAEGTITIDGQEANSHGEEDVTGATEVELEADDFYFEPTVLTGEAGQKLAVTVTNEGDSTHNFSVSDQDVDEDLEPGDSADVELTFPDSGTVVFFCKFHQGQGMLGGLEVGS